MSAIVSHPSGDHEGNLRQAIAVVLIIASIQASDGEFYRYPMAIRFVQ